MTGKTTPSSSTTTIPPEVLAQYQTVTAEAQKAAATPFQQYSTDPNAFVAPLNSTQNAAISGTEQYANAAQPAAQAGEMMTAMGSQAANPTALTGQNISQYENPYTSYVTQQESNLLNQQNQTAQSGQLGTAIQSGAFGGDRAGVAAANLAGQQSLAYGNAMAPILQQGYNTALSTAQQQQGVNLSAQQANLARQQAGGQQIANIGANAQASGLAGAQAEMGAGTTAQTTQQAGLTALYNQFLQQQSYPFQTAQFAANVAEGTGALSGSTTNTTTAAPFFSDRRLKEDIKKIGTAKNGLPIYSFRYKDDPEKITRLGFMADEVEKKHPEAVGLAGGFKTVDYDKAVKRYAGGLVVDSGEREGYDAGGAPTTWGGVANAQAGMYGGSSPSALPYGGKSHVPASTPSQHQMLQPVKPVAVAPQSTLSQLSQLGTEAKGLESLGTAGQRMYNAAKGLAPAGAGAQPPADVSNAPPPPPAPPVAPDPNAPAPGLAAGGAAGGAADSGDPEGLYHPVGGLDIPNENPTAKLQASSTPGAAGPSTISQLAGLGSAASGLSGLGSAASSGLSSLAGVLPFLGLAGGGGVTGRRRRRDNGGGLDPTGGATLDDPNALASAPSFANTPPADAMEPKKGLSPPSAEKFAEKVIDQPVAAEPKAALAAAAPPVAASRAAHGDTSGLYASAPAAAVTSDAPAALAAATKPGGISPAVDALWSRQLSQESGGKQYNADGSLVTSPKGAVGIAQVEPGTFAEMKAKYGIKGDISDPAANEMAGKLYMQEQYAKYGGDMSKALAAYNAGPGRVDKTIAAHGDSYLSFLPSETKGYISNILGGGLAGAGQQLAQNAGRGLAGAGQAISDYAGNAGQAITQAGQQAGGWYEKNKSWLGPLLQGIGTMASSNSRYLGAAALQGLGAGAGAYQKQQESQANVGQTLEGAKQTGARTQGIMLENLQKWTHVGAGGMPYATVTDSKNNKFDIPLAEAQQRIKNGEDLRPVDPNTDLTPRTPGAVQSGQGAPAAPAAPQPGQPAPQPEQAAPHLAPLPVAPMNALGVNFSPDSAKAAQSDNRYDPNQTPLLQAGDKYAADSQSAAAVARETTPYAQKLATTVSDALANKFGDVVGAGGSTRANLINIANTAARLFGYQGAPVGDLDNQEAIINKLDTMRATAAAHGAGQNSLGAFEALRLATPNTNMPPDAMASLTAQLMSDQQKAKDRADHLAQYGQGGAGGYARASARFDTDNGPEKYNRETEALKQMILSPRGPAMLHKLTSGQYSQSQIEEALTKKYGAVPGLSRYFASGG
jgi:soluble lytic murein transglycosylase-like protein